MRADAKENQRRIVEVARARFAAVGLSVSVNDIAAHAGVGIGTLYRRFPCKQDLVDAVFTSAVDAMVDAVQRAALSASGWDGLVAYLSATTEQLLLDRALRELVFGPGLSGSQFEDVRERLRPALKLLVDRAQTEGLMRLDVSAEDIPPLLYMLAELGTHLEQIPGMSVDRYMRILIDGLRARTGITPLDTPPDEESIAAFMSSPKKSSP